MFTRNGAVPQHHGPGRAVALDRLALRLERVHRRAEVAVRGLVVGEGVPVPIPQRDVAPAAIFTRPTKLARCGKTSLVDEIPREEIL